MNQVLAQKTVPCCISVSCWNIQLDRTKCSITIDIHKKYHAKLARLNPRVWKHSCPNNRTIGMPQILTYVFKRSKFSVRPLVFYFFWTLIQKVDVLIDISKNRSWTFCPPLQPWIFWHSPTPCIDFSFFFFLRAIGMVCENGCETNLERQVPYP